VYLATDTRVIVRTIQRNHMNDRFRELADEVMEENAEKYILMSKVGFRTK